MILFDAIKIQYIQSGYLPDHPYHLISDMELLDAFIINDENFFDDNYNIETQDEELLELHKMLKDEIIYHVNQAKDNNDISYIPTWVTSYMLGSVICQTSQLKDIDDLISLSNITDVVPAGQFNDILYRSNANISKDWIGKLPSTKKEHRPITVFGEPHVIKSLRLAQVDVLN